MQTPAPGAAGSSSAWPAATRRTGRRTATLQNVVCRCLPASIDQAGQRPQTAKAFSPIVFCNGDNGDNGDSLVSRCQH